MQPLSSAGARLLHRADQARSTEEVILIVHEMGAARAPEPLPFLLRCALASDHAGLVAAAARSIRQIVQELPPLALLDVDRRVRVALPTFRAARTTREPQAFAENDAWAVVALTSFHPSGYVREHAVRWLAGLTTGREVPFLILRMNDWVQPIRAVARDAMEQRLDPDHADALIQALPVLLRLPRWGRDGHGAFVRTMRRLLAGSACSDARRRGLASPDPLIRRELFALSLDDDTVAPSDILARALSDPDARTRLWAAQKLRADPDMEGFSRLLDAALRDRFPPVRVDALQTLAKHLGPTSRAALEEALLDPHPSIRRAAMRYLRAGRDAPFEPAAFYRKHLASSDGPRLCATILGLAETGIPADAARLAPFFAHPRVRIRRAAVLAVASLDLEGQAGAVLAALRDERASISNEAERALLRHPYIAAHHTAELAALAADEAAPAHARRNARAVLGAMP